MENHIDLLKEQNQLFKETTSILKEKSQTKKSKSKLNKTLNIYAQLAKKFKYL
jgi:hypothetical protein